MFRMKSCTFSVSLIKSRRPFVTFISLRSKSKVCAVLNDTFASVRVFRTFTHNMLAFGLSRKLCNDFLKKQAVIGNLNEGNTLLKIIQLVLNVKLKELHSKRLYYIRRVSAQRHNS